MPTNRPANDPLAADQPTLEIAQMTRRVLFLCTGNSARSVLAESTLKKWGPGRYESFSAGSQPKGEVHPLALQVLAHLRHRSATDPQAFGCLGPCCGSRWPLL